MNSGKSQLSKQQTILFCAEKLFAENGFDATSVREIAKAAGVNVAMISYYFGSKEQLLEDLFHVRMKTSLSFSESILNDDSIATWDKIEKMVDGYIKRVYELQDFYMILLSIQVTNKNKKVVAFLKSWRLNYMKIFSALFNKGIEEKVFAQVPSAFYLQSLINGGVLYALMSKKFYKENFGKDESQSEFDLRMLEEVGKNMKTQLKNLVGYKG